MSRLVRWAAGTVALIIFGSCTPKLLPEMMAQSSAHAAHVPQRLVPQARSTPRPTMPPVPLNGFAFEGAMTQGGFVLGTAPRGTTVLRLGAETVPVAPDGRFIIGFDRDHGPSVVLAATLGDGREIRQTLTIGPRAWQIERLNTLPKISQPSAEYQRRRPIEIAQINAARRMETTAAGWRQPFLWPVTGRVSGLFGSQRIYKGEPGSYHSGVDVAGPSGTPVLAPADGVVILAAASPFTLEGNLLMIDHGMGLNSAFLHLSRIDVRVGEPVKRGQRIGAVGMTGRATGPHLHWSLRWRAARIDPLLAAGPMPVAD